MATSDVEKLAIYDSRVVQTKPKFAVEKGALSITNAPFQALSQTTSQHTYSIQVPSENTYCDRAVNWTSTLVLQLTYSGTLTIPAGVVGPPITAGYVRLGGFGEGWSWSAFPLQTLTNTIQCTINDTNVTINTADVLKELLRLVDFASNRRQRTTPTKLDAMASCLDDPILTNSVYGGFQAATSRDEVPNGAFIHNSVPVASRNNPYCLNTGADFLLGAPSQDAASGIWGWSLSAVAGATSTTGGVPTRILLGTDGAIYLTNETAAPIATTSVTLFVKQTFTEKLVLPPFVFSDVHERDVGLFGIQNIQWVMNMRDPQTARVIRQTQNFATTFSSATGNAAFIGTSAVPGVALSVAYPQSPSTANAFSSSRIDQIFLTPPLDLPLPPKSVVPYMEMPRYITSFSANSLAANTTAAYQTQTITLPQIPDLIVIYAKPQNYADLTNGDWYLPISQVNIQWDNFAGLLSTATAEQLYEMSYNNGLDMDYLSWSGRVHTAQRSVSRVDTAAPIANLNSAIQPANYSSYALLTEPYSPLWQLDQSVGGFLVIKPGKDYALQTGQAPGLVGNYTFQANVTLTNNSQSAVTPVVYVMTINSGLFESQKGTSRVVKGVLSESDIISAPISSYATRSAMERAVGGAGVFSKLGNVLGKLPGYFEMAKPFIPVVKPFLPQQVQDVMGRVGLGEGEGVRSGGRRKAVAHRLK